MLNVFFLFQNIKILEGYSKTHQNCKNFRRGHLRVNVLQVRPDSVVLVCLRGLTV